MKRLILPGLLLGVLAGANEARAGVDQELDKIAQGNVDPIDNPSPRLTGTDRKAAEAVPDAVAELFSIVAEIALERAETQGLQILTRKLREGVCNLMMAPIPKTTSTASAAAARALPETCALLTSTSLQTIITTPKVVVSALMSDALLVLAPRALTTTKLGPVAKAVATESLGIAHRALTREPPAFIRSDAWALVSSVVNVLARQTDTMMCKSAPRGRCAAARMAVAIVRACIERGASSCEGPDIAAELLKTQDDALVLEAQRIALLGIEALQADSYAVRTRAAADFTFEVLFIIAPPGESHREALRLARELLVNALDRNVPGMIAAAARFGAHVLGDVQELRKGAHLLTAVVGYSATYVDPTGNEVAEAEARAAQREQKKQVIENLLDAVTDRSSRESEWVVSLGVSVGFYTGLQNVERSDDDADWFGLAPQLALPTGLAVQHLPGHRDLETSGGAEWGANGFHLMLSVIDLGQFLAYDPDGDIAPPRWNTVFAPGLQIAWAIGEPSNIFLVGADVRYAPNLFAEDEDSSPDFGGAFRAGVTLGYYVSIFDLN